jgi:hypothetical protein
MAIRMVAIISYRDHYVPSPNPTQPTRLTRYKMDERRENGLYFNCYSKYGKRHKCGEKKIFYIDCEEEEDQ